MKKQLLILFSIIFSTTLSAQLAISIPTEYEKSEKLLITWPYHYQMDSTIAQIAGIVKYHADVDIIFNPDSTDTDTTQIRNFLISIGSDSSNIGFIPAHTNTPYLRQYAPITGYGVFTDTIERYFGKPEFSDYFRPEDDSMAYELSQYTGWSIVDYELEFESSNIYYDGLRNLVVGDRILAQNYPMTENDIRFDLNSYYNSGVVTFLSNPNMSGGGDLNGLENYIKFIDYETILLSSIPDTLPDYTVIEEIYSELQSLSTFYGSPYEIIRIPAAPQIDGTYAISSNGINNSYTNSIIINDLAIIPSYGIASLDSTAFSIYSQNLPGYSIVTLDANLLSQHHAGLHTMTLEVPQNAFLRILHEKITGLQEFSPFVKINCLCQADSQVEAMWLYYKINNDTAYEKKEIYLVCPQHFAVIEKLHPGDTISYYIEAISSKTTTTYPISAPEGNFTFWLDITSKIYSDSEENTVIAPNPSNGELTISTPTPGELLDVFIYQGSGQLLFSGTFTSGTTTSVTNELQAGLYIIRIAGRNTLTTQKLIIQ